MHYYVTLLHGRPDQRLGPVLAKRCTLLHWFCVVAVRLSCDLTWFSPKIFDVLTSYCNAESKKRGSYGSSLKFCSWGAVTRHFLLANLWTMLSGLLLCAWCEWMYCHLASQVWMSVAQCCISASHCCPPVSCQSTDNLCQALSITLMSWIVWNCIMIYMTICILEIAHDTATFLMYS